MVRQRLTSPLSELALSELDSYCQRNQCTALDVALACLQQLQSMEAVEENALEAVEEQLTEQKGFAHAALVVENMLLKRENRRLTQENAGILQEKTDLEVLLENTMEHSDAVASDLHGQAKAAKQAVEEQFRLIAEATPVGILIASLGTGQIVYGNLAASDILGLSPEALCQRSVSALYQRPEDYSAVMEHLSGVKEFQNELRCLRANGQPFWGLLSLRHFTFKGDAAVLMALYDVTARKQAEEDLRLAEEKYRSIFLNALEGIYQSTPNGRYININPAMAKIHGFESADAMLAEITEISCQVYIDGTCRERFRELIEVQGNVEGFEYQIRHRDGTVRWLSENARAIRSSDGQLLYYEGIVHDVTDRKQRESNLQRELEELRIEIDHSKRAKQVEQITQTDYFQSLQVQVEELKWSDD
ncbi:MAG: PAS domain-containing protein [Cyanobacteria bacterium J06632_22]